MKKLLEVMVKPMVATKNEKQAAHWSRSDCKAGWDTCTNPEKPLWK